MPSLQSRTELESAVLSTLSYYEALALMALSAIEIQRYLMSQNGAPRKASLTALLAVLDSLTSKGVTTHICGFYALARTQGAPQMRILRSKYTIILFRKLLRAGRFLPYIPYTRSLALLGSVAVNNAHQKSDIDVVLGATAGNIWLVRFSVTLLAHILGVRRYGHKISSRLCFNQYQTDGRKLCPARIASAQIERQAICVWGSKSESTYQFKPVPILLKIKYGFEKSLTIIRLNRLFEMFFAYLQIKKIARNPLEYPHELPKPQIGSQNLIFYYPKVYKTEARYKALIAELGLGPRHEVL